MIASVILTIARLKDPRAEVKVTEPDEAEGIWFFDIHMSTYSLVIDWQPGHGFGVSRLLPGEEADLHHIIPCETIDTFKHALIRIMGLLD